MNLTVLTTCLFPQGHDKMPDCFAADAGKKKKRLEPGEALGPWGLCCKGQPLLLLLLWRLFTKKAELLWQKQGLGLQREEQCAWCISSIGSSSVFFKHFLHVFNCSSLRKKAPCCRWTQPVSSARCFSPCTLFSSLWPWWRAVHQMKKVKLYFMDIFFLFHLSFFLKKKLFTI